MEESSTLNLLVKTLYEDLTQSEAERLHAALGEESLKAEFDKMAQLKEALGEVKVSPSPSSIQVIMEHSQKTGRTLESTC